jgi:hypothetical protein
VLADDLGAKLGVAAHALELGRRELAGIAQHFGGDADLADVVERGRLLQQIDHVGLHARGLREQPRIL